MSAGKGEVAREDRVGLRRGERPIGQRIDDLVPVFLVPPRLPELPRRAHGGVARLDTVHHH